MPKKTVSATMAEQGEKPNKYRDGRWTVPSKRAKGYAEERKAKVHKWGNKEGKELTDFESGLRSGYLQCRTIIAAYSNTANCGTRACRKRKRAN